MEQLNLLLREVIARVVVLQAYTKGWLGARRYRKERERRSRGAVVIQSGRVASTPTANTGLESNNMQMETENSDVIFWHILMKQVQI